MMDAKCQWRKQIEYQGELIWVQKTLQGDFSVKLPCGTEAGGFLTEDAARTWVKKVMDRKLKREKA